MVGRQIDPIKAERARGKLRRAVERRDRAAERLNTEVDRLHSEVYRASLEGATYVQLASDLGVSKVRVYQIISEQKELREQASA